MKLRVLCTIGLQDAFTVLIPELQRASRTEIDVRYGVATKFVTDIQDDADFDIAILPRSFLDDLVKTGHITERTVTNIARSGLGLAVQQDVTKPDITTAESLKRTLLEAKTIATSATGLAGFYFTDVLDDLGIFSQVKPKLRLEMTGGYAAEIAARGEAEMAVQLVSEILPVAGVALVGPFPASVQKYAVIAAGLSPVAKQAEAATSVVRYLLDPVTDIPLKARGLERCA